jgi:hypothetical protein
VWRDRSGEAVPVPIGAEPVMIERAVMVPVEVDQANRGKTSLLVGTRDLLPSRHRIAIELDGG